MIYFFNDNSGLNDLAPDDIMKTDGIHSSRIIVKY